MRYILSRVMCAMMLLGAFLGFTHATSPIPSELSGLSQNEINEYYAVKNRLSDQDVATMQFQTDKYADRIERQYNYDYSRAITKIQSTQSQIGNLIGAISSRYPSDSRMPSSVLHQYYSYKLAYYDLRIIEERWKRIIANGNITTNPDYQKPQDKYDHVEYGLSQYKCQNKGGIYTVDGNGIRVCAYTSTNTQTPQDKYDNVEYGLSYYACYKKGGSYTVDGNGIPVCVYSSSGSAGGSGGGYAGGNSYGSDGRILYDTTANECRQMSGKYAMQSNGVRACILK